MTDDELKALVAENAKAIKELRESQKETSEQMKETDRQMKETDRQMKETDRKMKEVFSKLGDLGLLQGNIVEENICRSVKRLFEKEGKEFYEIYQNVIPSHEIRKKYGKKEYDIVAVNGSEVLITEVKSNVKQDNVNKFLKDQLPLFTKFFPEYKGYKILGAIGGALITPHVEKYAQSKGLYVIIQNGENLSLAQHPKNFKPVTFS